MRSPRDFFKPLAVGAPDPLREIPLTPSRMIHFFDPSNEKIVGKLPDIATKADIVLGNLEDAIAVDNKEAAREGLVTVGKEIDLGDAALWTRVNSLESPWVLDDLTRLVTEIGDKLDVIMVPKVEGAWDIHYVDRLLAQLEAQGGARAADPGPRDPGDRHGRGEPRGDRHREPADAGHELRPGRPGGLAADEDHPRRRRPPRLPGDRATPIPDDPEAPRATAQQDLWHYSIARMVDACTSAGILPFYGPFGDIKDVAGCEAQFRAAFLLGCVGAWSLHPAQIDIAKKVFSPDPEEVKLRQEGDRGDPGRPRRAHDRRQDAGRRHLEAVQGDGRAGRAAGREGPRAGRGVRARPAAA